jgi:AcrR family transcriptional regulator
MAATAERAGLRERKKQRTRQTIVEVAARLFLAQGYQRTPLAQIAEEADVATSTCFNYFPTKVDIVFSLHEAVTDSARRRIVERPEGERAIDAIAAWVREDLPEVEQPYAATIRGLPQIIASAPELRAEERLRLALLEDVLAAGFARDFAESPDAMRPRVLAAMALRGMLEAWAAWFEKHADDADLRLSEALAAKADYVVALLERGLECVELLPAPPPTPPEADEPGDLGATLEAAGAS